jgi:hypothetical protein
MLIIVALGVWFCVWAILRTVNNAPLQGPDTSKLDSISGIVVPCPPDHGTHCRCTWR